MSGNAAGSLPEEFTGGLGTKGLEELRAFAEAGGTLVTLDAASRLAAHDLGLGVREALPASRAVASDSGLVEAGAKDFYCPGALLRVTTVEDPLTAGLDRSAAIWFEESPTFDVDKGKVLARYPDENPLLSGWLSGERRLFGKAALVEAPLGRGRVVHFGFRPQYRGQSWATYPALLNAIYTSAATPVGVPAPTAKERRASRPLARETSTRP